MSLGAGRSDLWAVTCYFNPTRNQWRRRCYAAFRRRLNIPLVTVELSYDGTFDLSASDADILLRRESRDVLWQTERLFNVAFDAVPNACDKIAWIDCDIVFERRNWASAASRLLDNVVLIQLFENLYDQCEPIGNTEPTVETARFSAVGVASRLAQKGSGGNPFRVSVSPMTGRSVTISGGGWAARRDLVARHGVYDACILAGNDRATACAAAGHFDVAIESWRMNGPTREHYVSWAAGFFSAVRGRVGYLEGSALHLWHGDPRRRTALPRYEGLPRFAFDPAADMAIAENGCWRWSSPKPELHRYVSEFLRLREEGSVRDGDRRGDQARVSARTHEVGVLGRGEVELGHRRASLPDPSGRGGRF